jgi:hypothetical protein
MVMFSATYVRGFNQLVRLICTGFLPLDLQLSVQSVPMTSNVVSLNATHCEVYSIQLYIITFVSDLRQVGEFLRVLRSLPSIILTAML